MITNGGSNSFLTELDLAGNTNRIEDNRGAHWIAEDAPLQPLSLDLYMRDYFEPELVPRLITGSQFRPLRPSEDLNRTRPLVRIQSVQPNAQSSSVWVTIEAKSVASTSQNDDQGQPLQSGVYDLRLFRDGHLVGLAKPEGLDSDAVSSDESPLDAWRRLTRMTAGNSVATAKFLVPLARIGSQEPIRFSTYAFNGDRIKSETARCDFRPPASIGIRQGKAYLVTIGVGANQRGELGLLGAAGDARLLIERLTPILRRSFADVVPVPLIASAKTGDAREHELLPSKANIRAQLEALRGIHPEDLLVLTVAAHGRIISGQFAFSAYDEEVSARELARWLYPIDASQILLILDTCYAGAALGLSFKPAPLGDPTLGQLSFDKGMLVLVSTSPDEKAAAPSILQHSRLMEALVVEGLGQGNIVDSSGHLDLRSWAKYAVERVPRLETDDETGGESQTPKLLDFSLRRDGALGGSSTCEQN